MCGPSRCRHCSKDLIFMYCSCPLLPRLSGTLYACLLSTSRLSLPRLHGAQYFALSSDRHHKTISAVLDIKRKRSESMNTVDLQKQTFVHASIKLARTPSKHCIAQCIIRSLVLTRSPLDVTSRSRRCDAIERCRTESKPICIGRIGLRRQARLKRLPNIAELDFDIIICSGVLPNLRRSLEF
jgi:hypothetical protein